jgi:hypothetical protein
MPLEAFDFSIHSGTRSYMRRGVKREHQIILGEMGQVTTNKSLRRNEMKTLAYVLIVVVSIFCLTGIIYSKAEATSVEYVGEFCWILDNGFIVNLGASYVGGGHYLVNGRILADGTLHDVVSGNAEIEGNAILITVVSSGRDNQAMWTSTAHIQLDTSTFNGTYESIGHDRNYNDLSIDTEYEIGSLTLVQCP